jgi:hypothetical protein
MENNTDAAVRQLVEMLKEVKEKHFHDLTEKHWEAILKEGAWIHLPRPLKLASLTPSAPNP